MVYPKAEILETVSEGVLPGHKNYEITPESSYFTVFIVLNTIKSYWLASLKL